MIASLPGPWQPRDIALANDTVVRVARFEGKFAWHQHDEDRPVAEQPAHGLMIERPETLQYGN